jgi:hypothetical protein
LKPNTEKEDSRDLVVDFIVNVFLYLSTFKRLLLSPRSTYLNLSITNYSSPLLIKPGYFLIANIVITYLIGQFVGFTPINPFNFTPLNSLLSGYSFIAIRYILGILIFLYLLKFVTKQKSQQTFLQNTLPIFCYSSFVYLPIFVTKFFFFENISEGMIKEQSFSFKSLLKIMFDPHFLILSLLFICCIFWWLWLIYIGIKVSKPTLTVNPKKALIVTSVTYTIVLIFITIISSTIVHYPTLKGFKIIHYRDVEKEIVKKPPNFLKAASLATLVSDNKNMPEIFRYRFELKRIACVIAHFSPSDETLMYKVLSELSLNKCTSASAMLNAYFRNLSPASGNNKKSCYSTSFSTLKKQFEDAEALLNSSIYERRDGPVILTLGISNLSHTSEDDIACSILKEDINKGIIYKVTNSYYAFSNGNEIGYYIIPTTFISLFP